MPTDSDEQRLLHRRAQQLSRVRTGLVGALGVVGIGCSVAAAIAGIVVWSRSRPATCPAVTSDDPFGETSRCVSHPDATQGFAILVLAIVMMLVVVAVTAIAWRIFVRGANEAATQAHH